MKNKNLVPIVFVIVSIVISSCNKDTSTVNLASLTELTQEAINMKTVFEIRQAYSLLSLEEKQNLWVTKYNSILQNDKHLLTNTQKEIVLMLKNFLTSNGMKKLRQNPALGENLIKQNMVLFQNNFTSEELYMLIECAYFCNNFSIKNSKEYLTYLIENEKIMSRQLVTDNATAGLTMLAPNNPGGLTSNCSCYYSIYCQVSGDGVCSDGNCNKVQECGVWGNSNCTGTCSTATSISPAN